MSCRVTVALLCSALLGSKTQTISSTLLGSKTQTNSSAVAAHVLLAMLQRQACLPCVFSYGSCVSVGPQRTTHTRHCLELAAHAHPMQHNVHGVVLRAAAGGGQSVYEQRGAAGLRGQAVLQPHVRGHPVGQAAPVAAEPVRVVAPVKRLRCDKTDVLAHGFTSLDKFCLHILSYV